MISKISERCRIPKKTSGNPEQSAAYHSSDNETNSHSHALNSVHIKTKLLYDLSTLSTDISLIPWKEKFYQFFRSIYEWRDMFTNLQLSSFTYTSTQYTTYKNCAHVTPYMLKQQKLKFACDYSMKWTASSFLHKVPEWLSSGCSVPYMFLWNFPLFYLLPIECCFQ
jgi:hypothetical protein